MINLISVIIPIYKSEKWLPKCIESVMKQTYKNLEIILVDDGSPDKSPIICDKYAQKDSRIKVIHKSNEGVAAARNSGLEISTGKYVCFVDSDDWLPQNSIYNLYSKICTENADFVQGDTVVVTPLHSFSLMKVSESVCNKQEIDSFVSYLRQINWGPVGKLYTLRIIQDAQLRFPTGIKYGEDTIFVAKYLQLCKKMCLTSKLVYYYNRLLDDSAIGKSYDSLNYWFLKCVDEYAEIFEGRTEEIVEESINRMALTLFDLSCKQYSYLTPNDNANYAIEKLEETHLLFDKYVNDKIRNRVEHSRTIDGYIDFYMPYLLKKDYEKLYYAIRGKKKEDSFLKCKLKLIWTSIKIFLIFKVRIIYW